jgi:excinuclease ABC subunit C
VFTLITNIQDEVHRFAISYHKKLQSKGLRETELLNIEGIGKEKAKLLLKHFGSVAKIKKASIEDICQVKGIKEHTAQKIVEYFND